jgi:hypothetical protein
MPDARAETPFDISLCVAGPVTTLSSMDELTLLGVELKGVTISNHENKVFDSLFYHFFGVSRISAGQVDARGYSKITDVNGDLIFTETTTFGPLAKPNWKLKFLQGTGRWSGITGGGDIVSITRRSPLAEGTYRGCYSIRGTYELPK